ncbi:uncharacterized protein LOC117784291 [Drosophila innubila]|uniref:uncharacterized protein LOC117784291 n=1 Tax=Drosophila innubila TaxID=198719 RepID=UPI00148C6077|nr:uncharacterized protein LOC117784291 [Drosophila innubila]
MTKFAIHKNMNTEIWSSSQMAGTGGALKALAKNLANQLNLNRTEMKRVVARVISERHGQGDVGDYNGHMFYVKPERIDLTEQITKSKEAFDEMINRKQMQPCGSKNQMASSRSGSRSRSLTYNMAMRHNRPDKSLTGVITDQHHIAKPGKSPEIAVQISKPKILSTKSKQQIKRKPQCQYPQPNNSQAKGQPKSWTKTKSVSRLAIQSKPKPVTIRKKVLVKSEVKNLKRKPVVTKRPPRSQATASNAQRLNAGKAIQLAKPQPMLYIEPEPRPQPQPQPQPVALAATEHSTVECARKKQKSILKKKSVKRLPQAKSKLNSKRIYDQSWQEPTKMMTKRLRAGGILTKPNRIMNPTPNKARSALHWRNPYQYPGGAGATQRSHANQCSKSKYKLKLKPRISSNKLPISRNVARMKSKRSQARLAKQLERDEAIDDPERLEAGSMQHFKLKRSLSTNSRKGNRIYKLSARLEELAKPVFHGKPRPEKLPARSNSPIRKPKLKLRSRRRRRRVLVDSSLGSIAVLKGTSRSGLTPAKRHLTLAFLNKDSRSPRSPRRSRSVMWR